MGFTDKDFWMIFLTGMGVGALVMLVAVHAVYLNLCAFG